MRFTDRVVLVSGGTKGIGKAIAWGAIQEGAKVVVLYNNDEVAARDMRAVLSEQGECLVLQCDVRKEEDVQRTVAEVLTTFGGIDVLVNNAGGYMEGDEWNGDVDAWRNTFELNTLSAMILSKYVGEHFCAKRKGVIINIASRFSLKGAPGEIAYAASKSALVSITEAYSRLLTPFGRANAVSPGATLAGYWLTAPKEELEGNTSRSPNGRLLAPKEIADTVLFLASDEAKMITGQNILVDGGK